MRKHLDEETLENFYFRQPEQSEQLKHWVALYIQDTVQKAEPRSQSRIYERHNSLLVIGLTDKLNPVVPVILTMKERHRPLQSLGH